MLIEIQNSLNKPYFRVVEYAISFFQFLIYIYFNGAFVDNAKLKFRYGRTNVTLK